MKEENKDYLYRKLKSSTFEEVFGEIDFEGDIMVDLGEKVEYATVGSGYMKVPVGRRNISLFFSACQVKAMNPWATFNNVLAYMKTINNRGTEIPLSHKELVIICKNVIKRYEKGELKVYNNKSRRFLFNPEYELTTKQKQSLIGKYISKIISKKNRKIVLDYVKKTGLYNKTKISEAVGLSRNTVSKYVNMELVRKMIEEDGITDIVEISRKCKIRPHTVQEYMKELAEVVED